jgi:cation diffusion facilitator family transporter
LLAIKFAAYFLTKSIAILTDAFESIVNVTAGFIGWYSLYIAGKPRDAGHPYGHGKVEFISAAVEGTLIIVAGIFIILEAVLHLLHPTPVKALDWGILLVAASGIFNFIAGRIAIATGKRNNSLAITASGKHLISDAYSTLGLVLGLGILYFSGKWWVDSVVALLFAGIIIFTGYKIVRKSIGGIMDESDTEILEQLITVLNDYRSPNWIDLHNLRVIQYGSRLHIDCHLTLPWYFTVAEAHGEIENVAGLIKGRFGDALEVFIHSDPCLSSSCPLCIKANCHVRQHPFQQRIEWNIQNVFEDKKHELNTINN